jgi:hypothetical protein
LSATLVCVVTSLLPKVTVVPAETVSVGGWNPEPGPRYAPLGARTVDAPAGIGVELGLLGVLYDEPQDEMSPAANKRTNALRSLAITLPPPVD